jgi:hypothetical protein
MENNHNEAESIYLRLQEQNEVLMKIYGKLRSEHRQIRLSQKTDEHKDADNDDKHTDDA